MNVDINNENGGEQQVAIKMTEKNMMPVWGALG